MFTLKNLIKVQELHQICWSKMKSFFILPNLLFCFIVVKETNSLGFPSSHQYPELATVLSQKSKPEVIGNVPFRNKNFLNKMIAYNIDGLGDAYLNNLPKRDLAESAAEEYGLLQKEIDSEKPRVFKSKYEHFMYVQRQQERYEKFKKMLKKVAEDKNKRNKELEEFIEHEKKHEKELKRGIIENIDQHFKMANLHGLF